MIDDGVWSTGLLLHSVYKLVQDAQQLILSFDPAQKRIQVSDRSRPRSKILDPSSRSQIHLWSKSQISNLKFKIDWQYRHNSTGPLFIPTSEHKRCIVRLSGWMRLMAAEMTDFGWETGFFSQNPALSARDFGGNIKVMSLKSPSGTVLGRTFDWMRTRACTGLLWKPAKKFWFLGNYWRKPKVLSTKVYWKIANRVPAPFLVIELPGDRQCPRARCDFSILRAYSD